MIVLIPVVLHHDARVDPRSAPPRDARSAPPRDDRFDPRNRVDPRSAPPRVMIVLIPVEEAPCTTT